MTIRACNESLGAPLDKEIIIESHIRIICSRRIGLKLIIIITIVSKLHFEHSVIIRLKERTDSEKIVLKWAILLFVILLNRGEVVGKQAFPKLSPDHKITVTLSERKPFVFLNENGAPKGLDVLIIENFARKLNLKIDYFIVDSSLNYIFTDKNYFNATRDQTSLRSHFL